MMVHVSYLKCCKEPLQMNSCVGWRNCSNISRIRILKNISRHLFSFLIYAQAPRTHPWCKNPSNNVLTQLWCKRSPREHLCCCLKLLFRVIDIEKLHLGPKEQLFPPLTMVLYLKKFQLAFKPLDLSLTMFKPKDKFLLNKNSHPACVLLKANEYQHWP